MYRRVSCLEAVLLVLLVVLEVEVAEEDVAGRVRYGFALQEAPAPSAPGWDVASSAIVEAFNDGRR